MTNADKIRQMNDEELAAFLGCLFKEAADAIEEMLYSYNYYSDCDNCYYFGGCVCDHIDENGHCLGWKPIRKLSQKERKSYETWMEKAVEIGKQVIEEMKRRKEQELNDDEV